jgi:gliding motility-associated-like protein
MMKLFSISLVLMGCVQIVAAQSVFLERQVIGSTGALYNQGGTNISSTTGEVVVNVGESSNKILTQGFQQPAPKNLITFSIITGAETCIGAGNGMATIEQISGCEPPYQVLWSNGNTGLNSTQWSTGNHSVTVSSSTCTATQQFFIDLEEDVDCELVIYSGITPNGDGQNDFWHIDNIHLPRYQQNKVSIFNRWGDLVWSGENYNNIETRWSGEGKKERELPDGTYFYVVEFEDNTVKGYVELTR